MSYACRMREGARVRYIRSKISFEQIPFKVQQISCATVEIVNKVSDEVAYHVRSEVYKRSTGRVCREAALGACSQYSLRMWMHPVYTT